MWLIEWLQNTWQEIVAGVSVTSLIATVILIVKMWASSKLTGNLQKSVTSLTANLAEIANTKDTIDGNTKSNINLVERVQTLETQLIANNKALEAMLSIMAVVYMRSKDEDVRSSVASIIGTFKNGDVTIRNLKLELAQVKEELAKMKEQETVEETKEPQIETNVATGDAEVQTEVLMRG